jgi:CheY-like chemotaxis protein
VAKVLLVEDDNNLREIYQARLSAEGYDIVTAQNGEEALSVAKQNHPDLIISDVMMPRISGFEMLDILRNTDELKHTKVIMLTALGQAEDRSRAQGLGADKYLVKSQVTLEDIVNCAHDLLTADEAAAAATAPHIIDGSVHASTPDHTMLEQNALSQPQTSDPSQPTSTAPPAPGQPDKPPMLQHTSPDLTVPPQPSLSPSALAELQNMSAASASTQPSMPVVGSNPVILDSAAQTVTVPPTQPVHDPIDTSATAARAIDSDEAALQAQLNSAPTPSGSGTASTTQTGDGVNASASFNSPQVPPTPSSAAASANDQVIAGAVAELSGQTVSPIATPPATPVQPPPPLQPATPPPTPSVSSPTIPPPMPARAAAPAADPSANERPHTAEQHSPINTAIGGTKVIMPTSGMLERPDIQTLLAREEAKGPTASASPAVGSSITPTPTTPQPSDQPHRPFDPNNIAL